MEYTGIHWFHQLHKLQLDLTSHCNAACGACVRNENGGETRTGLELKHFDLDLFKRIATVDTKGWYIRQMSWNGNWGDSMMHPDIIEMVNTWTRYHPETEICIATNGAIRSTKFWSELAVALNASPNHKVDFAMDGMEDTHKLYRRKTSHAKLCENIKAFTDAGGSCHVYMTTFEHNKHQIEEVKELSRKLGAKAFKARGSFTGDRVMEVRGINEANNKFLPWDEANYTMKAWYPDDGQDRFTENDKQIDATRAIFRENERPNSTAKDGKFYSTINTNFESLFKQHIQESKCPWQHEGEVQLDPWGIVWPCCHTSLYGGGASHNASCMTGPNGINYDKELAPGNDHIVEEIMNTCNLNTRSLEDILSNNFFNNTLNTAIENADWAVCRNNCGICKD